MRAGSPLPSLGLGSGLVEVDVILRNVDGVGDVHAFQERNGHTTDGVQVDVAMEEDSAWVK